MTETDTNATSDTGGRPEFRGCMICYSAEWAAYAGKKAYRTVTK